MDEVSMTDLKRLLQECSDADATLDVDLSGEIDDTPFEDLGLDSLAIFNVMCIIEEERHVQFDYDRVTEAATPRALVDLINATPARSG